MPNKVFNRFTANATAQSSVAATADALSGSAGQTELIISAAGNLNGSAKCQVQLKVTAPPSTASRAELYIEESLDGGTEFGSPRKILTFNSIKTTADIYSDWIYNLPENFKLQWKPIGYDMTGVLSVKGMYPEVQATT